VVAGSKVGHIGYDRPGAAVGAAQVCGLLAGNIENVAKRFLAARAGTGRQRT